LALLLTEDEDGRLLFTDLPQYLYGRADGHRDSPHDDGCFISNKPPGMPVQYRPWDRQPEVPDDQWGQKSSDTDTDVQEDHCGKERIKEGEVGDNNRSYSEEDPGEHPHQYSLGAGHIIVDRNTPGCPVYEGGSAKPSLPQFLDYLPRILLTWEERDESGSFSHVEAHFTLLEQPSILFKSCQGRMESFMPCMEI